MPFSEKDIKIFLSLKKSLQVEKYKLSVVFISLSISIFLHVLGNKFELVFSIIALLILVEVYFSSGRKEIVALYEKALSLDADGIKLVSKNS